MSLPSPKVPIHLGPISHGTFKKWYEIIFKLILRGKGSLVSYFYKHNAIYPQTKQLLYYRNKILITFNTLLFYKCIMFITHIQNKYIYVYDKNVFPGWELNPQPTEQRMPTVRPIFAILTLLLLRDSLS